MIPQSKWKWYGSALNFCCGDACRFHMGTLIGEYVVSTVGARHDHNGNHIEVGCGRWGETTVFGRSETRDCGCPSVSGDCIEMIGYGENADCAEMRAGHMKLCRKYARKGEA